MSSERLIERLAGGLTPVRARRASREALILALIVVLELALLAATGEFRPDLSASLLLPQSWWKLGGLVLLSVVASSSATISVNMTASRAMLRARTGVRPPASCSIRRSLDIGVFLQEAGKTREAAMNVDLDQ